MLLTLAHIAGYALFANSMLLKVDKFDLVGNELILGILLIKCK